MADVTGATVLSAESVLMRPADAARLKSAGRADVDGRVHRGVVGASGVWGASGGGGWWWLGDLGDEVADLAGLVEAVEGGAEVPSVVVAAVGVAAGEKGLAVVERVLGLVQGWLAEPRLAEARLVL